ncbi:hypothetical protein H5410_047602 [Solanum commersonii]|uniref:Uncharacterized protein n=1 Tax=Solanum commersonii TaxID=4109 RepID=A0A9J5XJK0_SOLCO|nr:hypothetical protein H5410_047602 [Solanum commersonii]
MVNKNIHDESSSDEEDEDHVAKHTTTLVKFRVNAIERDLMRSLFSAIFFRNAKETSRGLFW